MQNSSASAPVRRTAPDARILAGNRENDDIHKPNESPGTAPLLFRNPKSRLRAIETARHRNLSAEGELGAVTNTTRRESETDNGTDSNDECGPAHLNSDEACVPPNAPVQLRAVGAICAPQQAMRRS
jgi:hypothetical protein